MICPECQEPYPSEAILLRHRQNDHPEEYAAETAGSAHAAQEAALTEEGRLTTKDGFLRRTGAKPDAPPTDSASLLDRLFHTPDPGAALPPWDQELQDRERP
jgi:hypothetical protein